MKRIFVGLLLATVLAGAAQAAPPLLSAGVTQAIKERIAAGEYPSIVVAVVDGQQGAVYEFGKLANGRPPTANTVYEIGSVTKTFTGLLLAEGLRTGTFAFDEPVAQLVPGLTVPTRDSRPITLGELATQHSGLPRLPGNFRPRDPADPYAGYGLDKMKDFLARDHLAPDSGKRYRYSNLGYGLLGYALAQQAGTTYASLVEKRVLKPLGMTWSGVKLTDAMRLHLALGHNGDGDKTENWHFQALAAAGALKSTGGDMLRYLKANMGVMKTPLLAAMHLAQQPLLRGPSKDEHVGLGWLILQTGTGEIIWHDGMTGGYASFIGLTSDGSRGVVVLTNVQQSVDDLGFAVLEPESPLAPVETAITLKKAALAAYAGYYLLAPHFVLTIFRDGDQLYAQATGHGAAPLYPSARNEFFAKLADIRISFKRDDDGGVTGLVLYQNGKHAAPRIATSAAAEAIGEKIASLDTATLKGYVGRYRLRPGAVFNVTLRGGQLYAQLTGQGAFPIFPSAKDSFFYLVADARIDFERDDKGDVVALVLHQNGGEWRAPRL